VQVILLEKVRNLGALGETVKVKPGYARNFLLPKGKAVYATKENIAKFELRREELKQLAAERSSQAEAKQHSLAALPAITILAKAGEEGKLFGSVSARDIAEAISKAGVAVEKHAVRLTAGPLRSLGDYEVAIELESDLTALVKIKVVAEG
jgi:large subunit ribosomal protein L9